jgi:hypothetical protein
MLDTILYTVWTIKTRYKRGSGLSTEDTRGEGGGLGDTFGDHFWVVHGPPRHFEQKGQDGEVKIKLPPLVGEIM